MSKAENRMMRRRLRSAYLSTVLSISLVLLLVGVASLLLVNARSVSDYFKEHMQISVLMKPDISDAQTLEYQVELDSLDFVLSTEFISKAQGTREMEQMLGEGFLDIFEASPIPASVNVRLKADYVSPDSLDIVKARILESPLVDEVEYQQSLIEALNSNLRKISLVLGILIVLLLFMSFVLINTTVRLNVFARRFTIHTMKLVGASWGFIRRPFMRQGLVVGIVAAIIAIAVLGACVYGLYYYEPNLMTIITWRELAITGVAVLLFGVILTSICCYISVNKFLRMTPGELYKI